MSLTLMLLWLPGASADTTTFIQEVLSEQLAKAGPDAVVVVGVEGAELWADWHEVEETRDARLHPVVLNEAVRFPDALALYKQECGLLLSMAAGAPTAEWVCPEITSSATAPPQGPALEGSDRTRYLYSPSAFPLGRGNGYISQKELVFTEAAYGVTDHWDIQAGSIVPVAFINEGRNLVLGTKLSTPIGNRVRLAAGAQSLIVSEGASLIAFAGATVGDEERHFTLNVGQQLSAVVYEPLSFSPMVSASWLYQYRDDRAFITETWMVLRTAGDQLFWPSAALRFMGSRFSVDVGTVCIIWFEEFPFIPWVDFSWQFSRNR